MHLIVFSILLIIHYFVFVEYHRQSIIFINEFTKHFIYKAIDYILNSFRFTGIMYILAYLAGFITFWNRHTYAWWFMFAVYVSNSLFTLINLSITIQAIKMYMCVLNIANFNCYYRFGCISDLYAGCFYQT